MCAGRNVDEVGVDVDFVADVRVVCLGVEVAMLMLGC